MRSLLWRLTLSHLLVALGVVLVISALSPTLLVRYYTQSEQQRVDAAGRGIARVIDSLAQSGARRDLELLVGTSARVIAGGVRLQTPSGDITAGNVSFTPGQSCHYTTLTRGGMLTVTVPLVGARQLLSVQRQVTLWAALAAIVLAIYLAYASANATSAPLVAMSRAAKQLADGDFAVSLRETGPTEVRSLAASMNHMAQSLASLDELRRDFIASASHELRAPLTSIRGFLDALQDGTATAEADRMRCLQSASSEVRRMTRLVEELLQLSRLQAGVLEFELAPTDLQQLIEGVLQSFEARLRERGVTARLQVQYQKHLPDVLADGERLVQVMVNLLDNALRYSPRGGEIEVRLEWQAQHVICTVRDHGPGIPEADLADIFERFHKADPARQVGDQGAGLGLAIAKEIVLRHGGEVFARNAAGGGAEVGFWVPV